MSTPSTALLAPPALDSSAPIVAHRPGAAERDRVVAELQAIVVGALDAIGAHAAVARTLLGVDDLAARERIAAISRLALQTLEELRRLLGALAGERLSDAERAAIARDVHDSVGHGVSLAGVLAGAALAVMDRDREAARRSLGQLGTAAAETRRELAALLAPAIDDAARTAQLAPTAADLPALIACAGAGQPVRLRIAGPGLEGVPAEVLTALHRIVQEALTNARRHAPGAAVEVTIAVAAGTVDVEIVNGPAPRLHAVAATGCRRGIAGMRERARLLGGGLEAGPRDGGGFAVRARLPR